MPGVGEARAGGHGDGRAGRGAAGKGAQRRPGRETPPAGGNARAAARRTGAGGGGGGRQAREQREEKPGGRPPTARGPPCLPLSPSTQPHARVRPRRPTTDGWLEAGRPTPWSDTKTPRARGHEAPRGHSPGGSARRRKDTAASRGPPPGHASPGRGHARDTASGRAARPDRARRCLGGARGAEGTPGVAVGELSVVLLGLLLQPVADDGVRVFELFGDVVLLRCRRFHWRGVGRLVFRLVFLLVLVFFWRLCFRRLVLDVFLSRRLRRRLQGLLHFLDCIFQMSRSHRWPPCSLL